jgi:hypothetical protein
MAIEDEHADVLQNLEFAITSVHRDEPNLLDLDVIEALDVLIRGYGVDEQGRSWPRIQLSERAGLVVEACREVCEWRLGRASMRSAAGRGVAPAPIPVAAIVQCLKRLRKSVRLWNDRDGRQGYLEYVEHFLP